MTDPVVWLNGGLAPESAARIDPRSQGFLCGMGVYDSLLLRGGRPVFLERHLRRLAAGAARLGLAVPDACDITAAVTALTAAHGLSEGRVRITLAAGASPTVQPADNNIMLITLSPLPPIKASAALTVTPFRRNQHSPLAGIKFTACADSILAQRAALAAGFDEAIFLNTAGDVCEGAFSNIFLVIAGKVLTPALASGCLAGVTREVVLELCAAHDLPAEERMLAAADLREAEEIFVTSSIRGVQPVHRLDEHSLAAPGRVTALLASHFQASLLNTQH